MDQIQIDVVDAEPLNGGIARANCRFVAAPPTHNLLTSAAHAVAVGDPPVGIVP